MPGGCPVLVPAQPHKLDTRCFQPCQQTVQCGLIRKRTAHHGLDGLVGGELLEAAQRAGREEARDPDLVVDGHHVIPHSVSICLTQPWTFPLQPRPTRRR